MSDPRTQIMSIIAGSAEGSVTVTDLDAAAGSLPALGYSSLAYLRMIDALETAFGIEIEPDEDDDRLRSVDGIVALVTEQAAHV